MSSGILEEYNRVGGQCEYPVRTYVRGNQSIRPCGLCVACQIKKQQCIVGRCVAEAATVPSMVATLTIDDDHLSDVQLDADFWRRAMRQLRRRLGRLNLKAAQQEGFGLFRPKPLIRWQAELGSQTLRQHCHVLLFGVYFTDLPTKQETNLVVPWWKLGTVTRDKLTSSSAAYVSGYVCDPQKERLRIGYGVSNRVGYDYVDRYIEHMREGREKHGCRYSFYPDEYGYLDRPMIEIDHRRYPIDPILRQRMQDAGLLYKMTAEETNEATDCIKKAESLEEHGFIGAQKRREQDAIRRKKVLEMRAKQAALNDTYMVNSFGVDLKDLWSAHKAIRQHQGKS